jgi:hypothetical protein
MLFNGLCRVKEPRFASERGTPREAEAPNAIGANPTESPSLLANLCCVAYHKFVLFRNGEMARCRIAAALPHLH